jgi:hypothetical protein
LHDLLAFYDAISFDLSIEPLSHRCRRFGLPNDDLGEDAAGR